MGLFLVEFRDQLESFSFCVIRLQESHGFGALVINEIGRNTIISVGIKVNFRIAKLVKVFIFMPSNLKTARNAISAGMKTTLKDPSTDLPA